MPTCAALSTPVPTTKDLLALLSAAMSSSLPLSAGTTKSIEDALAALDAVTPKTPKVLEEALLISLESPAVQAAFEQFLARVLQCAKQLGWAQGLQRPPQASEFGGQPMLFAQTRVATADGQEKLRIGLRLMAKTAPKQVGAAFLVLEVARDEEGNGLLPGPKELVLLKELAKFEAVGIPLDELALAAAPEKELGSHFALQLGRALQTWSAQALEELLNDAFSV